MWARALDAATLGALAALAGCGAPGPSHPAGGAGPTLATAAATTPATRVLDDMRDATPWRASASEQVQATLRRAADGALCLDYDFGGVSGYAVLQRTLPVDWPARFDLVAQLSGSGATNDLQLKLVDGSGDSVWWVNRRDAELPQRMAPVTFRSRQVDFAWGPTVDRTLRHTQTLEWVVAAGRDGGKGALCVARIELTPRAPLPVTWPVPRIERRGASIDVDLGMPREFNGIWIDGAAASLRDYDVHASMDGQTWEWLRQVRGASPGAQALYLPEREARWLSLRPVAAAAASATSAPTQTPTPTPPPASAPSAARTIDVRTAQQWPDRNAALAELARAAPRGDVPRAYLGQQNYWALVGVDGGGERSALVSEDGAVEWGRGSFSVEPALRLGDGSTVTWAQAQITQSLRDGYLPMPTVHWAHPAAGLAVDVAADGAAAAPRGIVRYRVRNRLATRQRIELLLAVRPWQVNPPQQFLTTPGGASPIARIGWDGRALDVDGRGPLRPSRVPDGVAGLGSNAGIALAAFDAAAPLAAGAAIADPAGMASARLRFALELGPGEEQAVTLEGPLQPRVPASRGSANGASSAPSGTTGVATTPLDARTVERRLRAIARGWHARLDRVRLQVPPAATPIVQTLRTTLAHMLVSRDGVALRPGTRSYARTWIRDGAMMVDGLLRMGEVDAARAFVDDFSPHVYPSGKVPCCVDRRGSDPVVENDSHGQYLYAVAQVWRYTRDLGWLRRHGTTVGRVVGWIAAERAKSRAPLPDRVHGLMPPSISHEGYSDKPAYSYWDDFWTLRGLKDATAIAQALGDEPAAAARDAERRAFERDLVASIEATGRHYGLPGIAGAADRGDFDPTSTTMALDPAQAQDVLPAPRLAATFDRYVRESRERAAGTRRYKDYTPYELRNVAALVQVGRGRDAIELLDFFLRDRRPAAWNQWAEVVLPDAREARFLGDMPHAWVSSDYVRSALTLFAYPGEVAVGTRREPGSALPRSAYGEDLVLAAGIPAAWLEQGDVGVHGLGTTRGPLDYVLRRQRGGWQLQVDRPAGGGLHLVWPEGLALPRARTADGRVLAWTGRRLALPDAPLRVVLQAR